MELAGAPCGWVEGDGDLVWCPQQRVGLRQGCETAWRSHDAWAD
jgi:hypothetical protein